MKDYIYPLSLTLSPFSFHTMSLFQELDFEQLEKITSGEIVSVEPGSVAQSAGILPGDRLLAINDTPIEDIIDVQFYTAEEEFDLLVRRGDELLVFEIGRDYGEELGLNFSHPTFDTDIRRCNNLCEFCFVLQMGPKFRRTLYIKDDDYRYSFLFGHFVTLTNLSDHDWWRIEHMGLSPLYVSVHVTDWEKRRQFLRNKTAPDILPQLKKLAGWGVEIHTQLVIVPEFNDGEWLERSIRELADMWPAVQSVSVVPVGLTSHHKYSMRVHTQQEAADTLDYVHELQDVYLEKFGVRFLYPTDEWYLVSGRDVPPLEAYDDQALHENGLGMVRGFLDEWTSVKAEIGEWKASHPDYWPCDGRRLTLATGALFADTLQQALDEFETLTGIETQLQQMKNIRLGEGITAAGLLMAEDVLIQLGSVELGDVVILPRIMFDHPDTVSLDDVSPQACANRLGKPIALADTMGDVWDVIIGESKTLCYPEK